jgi:hypothetical protein
MRALNKKLRNIESLIAKQKNGEELDEQQMVCALSRSIPR